MGDTLKSVSHTANPTPSGLDRQLGDRLRLARATLGLTPAEFARRLGLSETRTEEYESGTARLAAGDLLEFARLLDLDVGYFFGEGDSGTPSTAWIPGETPLLAASGRESLDLLRAFTQIASSAERRRILRLVEGAAGKDDSRA